MHKLIVLVAESCAGKDTVLNTLVSKHNMNRVISHTTRPIRKNEKQGVDYHFVSDQRFKNMDELNLFVETRKYNTIQNGEETIWCYGVTKAAVSTSLKNNNAVIILDLDGLKDMKKYMGEENMISFYLQVNEEERLRRAKARGDEEEEVLRRLQDDKIKFAEASSHVNLTIYNQNGLLSHEDIAWIINKVANERL